MTSEIKAASDTRLHQSRSISLLVPIELISSIDSENISKYRSGNNISSRKKIHNQNSIESIDNNLINTHFPIVNIQKDSMMISKTSSSQLPTVPKQTGTFLHRFVNKFFPITNKKQLSRTKRIKQQQRLKIKMNKNKHCNVCRKHRNCFSTLPTDSLDYPSQSPKIINTNATTTLKNDSDSSISIPKIKFQKIRTLNQSQCQKIASALEIIFDTLISNYQQI